MSLVTVWSPFFQSPVRMRGRSYQLAGRVQRIEPSNGELVRAEVRGREPYTVTIHADGRHAIADCTCPRFAEGVFCKHLWATLLDLQQDSGTGPGASADDLSRLRPRQPKARKRDADAAPTRSAEPEWIGRLSLLRPPTYDRSGNAQQVFPAQRQICYVVLPRLCSRHGGLVVDLRQRTAIASGWSKSKALKISPDTLESLADPADRELCALILGGSMVTEYDDDRYSSERSHATYRIALGAQRALLKRLIATGRCFIDTGDDDERVERELQWDGDRPWVLWMVGTEVEDQLVVKAQLRRGEEHWAIDAPQVILGGIDGLIIGDGKASPFDDRDAFRWATQFREDFRSEVDGAKPIRIPMTDIKRFLDRLYMLPQLPEIDLPTGVGREELHVEPQPHLDMYSPTSPEGRQILSGNVKNQLAARVWFDYGGQRVNPSQPGRFVPVTPPPEEDGEVAAGVVASTTHEAEAGSVATLEEQSDSPDQTDTDAPPPQGVLMRRHRRAEREAIGSLATLGLRQVGSETGDALSLPLRQMPLAVAELSNRGWVVSADQQALRVAGPPSLTISSGIDWFELRGNMTYTTEDGRQLEVGLPEILAAARDGRNMVTLGDGSTGLLPEQWLTEHGLLTALGKLEGDHLRFKASQAAMLDALIDDKELMAVDDPFRQARERLHQFEGVKPLEPDTAFQGSLREYQKNGLGWFGFLRWFGVGGILADDMGLGKTIQVLSMLQARQHGVAGHADKTNAELAVQNSETSELPESGLPNSELRTPNSLPPSLIVVPRSVVFNWVDEAKKFTPDLRVMAYTGADRQTQRDAFDEHDVIVTSFGLMRRDIEELRQYRFDYVVLDEAQAIKNPTSQSAKAARLLDSNHRLALTGTPIENHLGDIWSIFEFLNPGMLGANARFNDLMRSPQGGARTGSNGNGDGATDGMGEVQSSRAETLRQVAASLRPFILRRTKQQVLRDLPPKTEQTLLCQMEPEQRKVYDDLRRYYHGELMQQLDASGAISKDARAMGGGKGGGFMVLEALLRLRQAACHPGLINDQHANHASAKLDVLLDRLADIIEEGSKALVFSQFTSMLALVKPHLESRGIKYCYLDGQTRDRKGVVEKFQTDESIPLFLISLKTGGLGLNLTAAEYVFILDPWWNPAVEAQAIDRTHRIGQTKPVFAYRMICEDTVEQRISELQQRKRDLAAAIVGGEENVLRNLSREDLERLLS